MYVIEASALNKRPALLASEERGEQDLVWHSYDTKERYESPRTLTNTGK